MVLYRIILWFYIELSAKQKTEEVAPKGGGVGPYLFKTPPFPTQAAGGPRQGFAPIVRQKL